MAEKFRYVESPLSKSVGRLVKNPAMLQTLAAVRKNLKDGIIDSCRYVSEYAELQEVLLDIYQEGVKIARSKLGHLNNLLGEDPTDRANENAELNSLVWSTIVYGFNWDHFAQDPTHGSNAFVGYLNKASYAALYESKEPPRGISKGPILLTRVPEETLITKEEREDLSAIIIEWMSLLPEETADTIKEHYLEGKTIEELATATQLTPGAIRKRLRGARKPLADLLIAHGFRSKFNDLSIFSNNIGIKRDNLEQRRAHLEIVFPDFEPLLSPQVKKALVIYFGLNGCEANYSFEETARQMNTSPSNIRHLISTGWNIVSRHAQPSEKTLFFHEKRKLYDAWKKNLAQFSFSPNDVQLLKLYFEDNLSTLAISGRLGMSDSTVQRHINRLLEIVSKFTS